MTFVWATFVLAIFVHIRYISAVTELTVMVTFVHATYVMATFVRISYISAVTEPILKRLLGANLFGA